MQNDLISLYDMDGTLCAYEEALIQDLEALRSPFEPPVTETPKDDAPAYLRARADIIRRSADWWEKLPRFQLGFDVWEITKQHGYRHMILTAGPRRNANAWTGKKRWIDANLGMDVDITITRDKSLCYGRILVDDWPDYVLGWLKWRTRSLVIMPASPHNVGFSHPQVIRYDGTNLAQVEEAIIKDRNRKDGVNENKG